MSANRSRAEAGRPGAPRRNLVSLARPYFGLIVFCHAWRWRRWASSRCCTCPAASIPRWPFRGSSVIAQSPGLAVKDVEVAVTRPIEEAVSVVLGVQRVQSKIGPRGGRDRHRFRSRHRHGPGPERRPGADGRSRQRNFPPGTSTIVERQTPSIFPIISFVVTGGRDPAALHDYAYYDLRPRISRIPDVSYVTVQGGDVREIVVEVEPQRLVAAGLSLADVADRLGKEHRLKAVGRIDRGTLQYQVLTNTQATSPLDLEDRVVAHKNGQSIRVEGPGPGRRLARRPHAWRSAPTGRTPWP